MRDVYEMMRKVTGQRFSCLRVDGGAAKNDFLMQFQSDILPLNIERPRVIETTAFGAAGIAGISSGFWSTKQFLSARRVERVFKPLMKVKEREKLYARWKDAVQRSLHWEK